MFYGGLVRSRNVLSVLMHCFAIACLASVAWLVVVYSLAFSDGGGLNSYIGGLSKAFLTGVTTEESERKHTRNGILYVSNDL